MEESFLEERFDGLQKSVNEGLSEMRTDGLALILQKHPASLQFAAKRLHEVLNETISKGRESIISKLSDDLKEAEKRKNKFQDKLTKCTELSRQAMEKVNGDNSRLSKHRIELINDVENTSQNLISTEKGVKTMMETKTRQIDYVRKKTLEIEEETKELKASLKSLKELFSKQQTECMSTVTKSHTALLDMGLKMCVAVQPSDSPYNLELIKKVESIKNIRERNNDLRKSLNSIQSYLKTQAKNFGITDRAMLNDQNFNFERVINKLSDKAEDSAVHEHFNQAEDDVPEGVTTDKKQFSKSVSELYHQKLLEKEKQYDKTIREAKLRRESLKHSLANAAEQLNELKMGNDNYDVLTEIQKKRSTVESSKMVLDEAFSKLGLSTKD